MRSILTLLISGLSALVLVNGAGADVVVPNDLATVEANDTTRHPFNIGDSSQRYQQVYDASDFPGTLLITGIGFRPDAETGGAFASVLSSIQINLSTTAMAPDGLSATFADNVGSDDTIVFGPGPLTLSSLFTGPAGGPKDFDILIALTTPFLYDPTLGNLLLDVRNFEGGSTTDFDSEHNFPPDPADSISRVRTAGSGVDSDTADVVDSSGIVTLFITESSRVPEPTTLLMLTSAGLGATATAAWRRWRRKQR